MTSQVFALLVREIGENGNIVDVLYSDQCDGFCVSNIMSRMSGHVYPQSFMILNVFTIMFDLVHMQSQSFQMIFQSYFSFQPK